MSSLSLASRLLQSALVVVAATAACCFALLRPLTPMSFQLRPLAPISTANVHLSGLAGNGKRSLSFDLHPVAGSAVAVTIGARDVYCGRPRSRVVCSLPRGLVGGAGVHFRVTVVE